MYVIEPNPLMIYGFVRPPMLWYLKLPISYRRIQYYTPAHLDFLD
jgi:hypothetical protein